MAPVRTTIDRYEVVRRIGGGGMGMVYLAFDPRLKREIAVKVLRSFEDAEARERFLREMRIAGSLSHENIVTIFDAGEHNGQPFIAMEYLRGETLDQLIARRLPMPLRRKLELVMHLCAGLAHAHKADIVHRDIKPSNLVIDSSTGRLKILDFGIARISQPGDVKVTSVGTPNYMAPEQILGKDVDRRADIFAAGLVTFELVTGHKAFEGETAHQVWQKILYEELPVERIAAAGLPPGLGRILETALAKSPEQRYRTVQQMLADVKAVHALLPDDEATIVLPADLPDVPPPPAAETPRTPPPGAKPPSSDQDSGLAGSGSNRRRTDLQRLLDERARRIETHREAARRALMSGAPRIALEEAEHALMIDPADAASLELIDRAREAVDNEITAELLTQARSELQDGKLTAARGLVDQALQLVPKSPEAALLLDAILRERRERDARAVAEAVRRGRAALAAGDPARAGEDADRALAIDPSDLEAKELKARATAAVELRRAQETRERAAREVVDQAERLFREGSPLAALRLLDASDPLHPLIRGARVRLAQAYEAQLQAARQQAAEQARQHAIADAMASAESALRAGNVDAAEDVVARLRRDGVSTPELDALASKVDAERRAAAERRRQEEERRRRVQEAVATADRACQEQQFERALEIIHGLRGDGATHPDLAKLAELAKAGKARLEQERAEAERRGALLQAGLAEARDACAARDFPAAVRAAARLRDQQIADPALDALEAEIQRGQAELEAERLAGIRAQALTRGLADAATFIARGDHRAALRLALQLKRDGFSDPAVGRLTRDAEALRDAAEQEEAAARARRDALGRGLAAAADALSTHDPEAADQILLQLARDGLADPTIDRLRRQAAALREQLAEERAAEAARHRAFTDGLAEATEAFTSGNFDGALQAVDRLRRQGFADATLDRLAQKAEAARTDMARRKAESERQRAAEQVRAQARQKDLAAAAAALTRGEIDAAIRLIEQLTADAADEAEIRPLRERAEAEKRRLEADARRVALAAGLAEARDALTARDFATARRSLARLHELQFADPAIDELLAEAQRGQAEDDARRVADVRAQALGKGLTDAAEFIARRDHRAALRLLAQLTRDGFTDPEIARLTHEAGAFRDEAERERAASDARRDALARGLAAAAEALGARDAEAADQILEQLQREELADPAVDRLRQQAAALRAQLADERAAEAARHRAFTEGLAAATEALTAGNFSAALQIVGRLRQDGFTDPALDRLARHAESARADAARRRADADRRRADEEARQAERRAALEAITAALGRGDPSTALRLLDRWAAERDEDAEFAQLRQTAESARTEADRRRAAQQARQATLDTALAAARAALDGNDPAAALAIVEKLGADGFTDARVARTADEAHALRARLERQRAAENARAKRDEARARRKALRAQRARQVAEALPGVDRARMRRVVRALAAAAAILLTAIGGWYWSSRPAREAPARTARSTPIATTAPAVPPPLPAVSPVATGADTTPDLEQRAATLAAIRRQFERRNLAAAAHALVDAWRLDPKAPELEALAADLRRSAATVAQAARSAAATTASKTDLFAQADQQLRDASRLVRPEELARAVGGYLASAELFRKAPSEAAAATAASPVAADADGTRTATADTKVALATEAPTLQPPAASVETKSVAVSTTPAYNPPPPPVTVKADRSPVDQETPALLDVLERYRAAYQALDVSALTRLYPSMPAERQRRFTAMKKACREHQVTLSEPQIIMARGDRAQANATLQYVCRHSAGGGVTDETTTETFIFRRAAGVWLIANTAAMEVR